MIYVGLDISSVTVGICIMCPDEDRVFGTAIRRTIKKSSKFLPSIHGRDLGEQTLLYIKDIVGRRKNVQLCIEEYHPGRNKPGNPVVVPWIQGYIVALLEQVYKKYKSKFVVPISWKFNLVNERTRGKEKIQDSVSDVVKKNKWNLICNIDPNPSKGDKDPYQDVMDAFGIAYYFYCGADEKAKLNI